MDESTLEQVINQNPYEIYLNFSTPAGVQSVTFEQLDHLLFASCQGSVIAGVRMGASIIAMISLYFLMKDKKTPLFIFNQLTLFFLCIRSGLYSYYYLSALGSITYAFSGYYLISATDRALSATTNVLQIFVIACVEAAMVCQVYAMYRAKNGIHKHIMLVVLSTCATLGAATVGFYINSVVYAVIQLYSQTPSSNKTWQLNVPLILFLTSVCFTSACLVGKFIFAFKQRQVCGKRQFSGIHALFIMTFQTMIIPTAINIASYNTAVWKASGVPELAIFITAIFLPLATMWAKSANDASMPYSDAGYRFSSPFNDSNDILESYKAKDLATVQDVISTNSHHPDLYDLAQREANLRFDSLTTETEKTDDHWKLDNSKLENNGNWDYDLEKSGLEVTARTDNTSKEFVAITAHRVSKNWNL